VAFLYRTLPLLLSLSLAGCGFLGDDEDEDGDVIEISGGVSERQMSEEELLKICADLVEDGQTKAMKAQKNVEDLQTELESREAELRKLKAEDIKDESRKAAAVKKWRAMEAELETLRTGLAAAEEERDILRDDLKETLVQLDQQIAETKKFKKKAKVYRAKAIQYKTESTENMWKNFNSSAKVEICDRGSRKRHANCHESVDAAFSSSIRKKFEECVDTYQAVPVLKQLEKKEAMPHMAQALPDNNKFTKKGWVIIWCDPSLPEAGDRLLSAPDPDLEGGDEPAGRDVLTEPEDDMDF
jgi:hypothetical protein